MFPEYTQYQHLLDMYAERIQGTHLNVFINCIDIFLFLLLFCLEMVYRVLHNKEQTEQNGFYCLLILRRILNMLALHHTTLFGTDHVAAHSGIWSHVIKY